MEGRMGDIRYQGTGGLALLGILTILRLILLVIILTILMLMLVIILTILILMLVIILTILMLTLVIILTILMLMLTLVAIGIAIPPLTPNLAPVRLTRGCRGSMGSFPRR